MKHISIIVTKDAILGNIEGPNRLFTEANQYLENTGRNSLFKIELVSLSKESQLNDGLYTISTKLLSEIIKTDLKIIPAMYGDLHVAIENNREFIP